MIEILLVMSFMQVCGADTQKARYLVFRVYAAYIIILTALALYLTLAPNEGMKKLSKKAVLHYCEELSVTTYNDFDSIDECIGYTNLYLRRNELIVLNFKFIVQLHFFHVIWSHL